MFDLFRTVHDYQHLSPAYLQLHLFLSLVFTAYSTLTSYFMHDFTQLFICHYQPWYQATVTHDALCSYYCYMPLVTIALSDTLQSFSSTLWVCYCDLCLSPSCYIYRPALYLIYSSIYHCDYSSSCFTFILSVSVVMLKYSSYLCLILLLPVYYVVHD